MQKKVKDFMSTPVTTTAGDISVLEIREIMKEKGIHAIPVVSYKNDTLKVELTIRGIITATDINKKISENATVEEVMSSSSVHVIHVDATAQSAAKMMLKHNVHHLVVMDEGEIVGMISSLDFVKIVAELSGE